MNALQLLHAPDKSAPNLPREMRLKTVILIARILANDRDNLCRVRNVSSGGLCIETLVPVEVGEEILVEFKNGMCVLARVAWAGQDEAGLQFEKPIDTERLLPRADASLHLVGAKVPRGPRLSTQCPVAIRRHGYVLAGVLENISQGGALLRLPATAHIDDKLVVIIPGLGSIEAAVRRTADTSVGVAFSDKLGFAKLARWLEGADRFSAYPTASLA